MLQDFYLPIVKGKNHSTENTLLMAWNFPKPAFLFKTNATHNCFCKSDLYRGNPLINIHCVLVFVTGCEIDVILVRMKTVPPSHDIGNGKFLSLRLFWTVVFNLFATLSQVAQFQQRLAGNGADIDP